MPGKRRQLGYPGRASGEQSAVGSDRASERSGHHGFVRGHYGEYAGHVEPLHTFQYDRTSRQQADIEFLGGLCIESCFFQNARLVGRTPRRRHDGCRRDLS